MKLNKLTITKVKKGLKNKDFSSQEVTQSSLERIKHQNPEINSFITVFEEQALQSAKNADKKIRDGEDLPLLGVPIAVKDNFLTQLFVYKGKNNVSGNIAKSPYADPVTLFWPFTCYTFTGSIQSHEQSPMAEKPCLQRLKISGLRQPVSKSAALQDAVAGRPEWSNCSADPVRRLARSGARPSSPRQKRRTPSRNLSFHSAKGGGNAPN